MASTNMESTLRSTRSTMRMNNSRRKGYTRKKSNKKIVHQIFQKCMPFCKMFCNEAESTYWETILDGMSRNIFPHGFRFRSDALIHTNSNKKLEMSSNVGVICREIISFMKKHGVISDRDQHDAYMHHINGAQEERTVADIKKRPLERKMVFMTYAAYISEEMSKLTNKPVFDLKSDVYSVMNDGYTIGSLTTDDIVFKKGIIVHIPKLMYNESIGFYLNNNGESVRNPDLVNTLQILPHRETRNYTLWEMWPQVMYNVIESKKNERSRPITSTV